MQHNNNIVRVLQRTKNTGSNITSYLSSKIKIGTHFMSVYKYIIYLLYNTHTHMSIYIYIYMNDCVYTIYVYLKGSPRCTSHNSTD